MCRERLAHGKKLLEQTMLSVSEIAVLVGFEDPTYFHKLFRRTEKMTPLDYRRNTGRNMSGIP